MSGETIRIAGASGFWGDAARSTPQLLKDEDVDFIVYDYLAEITMSIMARARAKNPDNGYALDFVSAVMKPNLTEIARQSVRIVSNAGGVNPRACADALRSVIADLNLDLRVACVLGDDMIGQRDEIAAQGHKEMFSGDEFPDVSKVVSINAYLGAFPVARALQEGADIVITGRSVDSAVTLGACIDAFGWGRGDLNQLAMGSLAGHILECGPQATGGNFTDWEFSNNLENIGYPVAEIRQDGSFLCSKPKGTGGLVSVGTIAEQMVYEIGDPQAYILPDVVCDFSEVELTQIGKDLVEVKGATGLPAPDSYKVCCTYADEFRGGTTMTFYGFDADKKANKLADAIFAASRSTLNKLGMSDYSETSVELIGAESQYGINSAVASCRELSMKIAVKHSDPAGIGILLKECVGLGLATPPGLSGFQGGRPKPSPVVRLFSFVQPKGSAHIQIEIDGNYIECPDPGGTTLVREDIIRPAEPKIPEDAETVEVPLIKLAWGRSGDKGDKANVGIIARQPEFLPYIYAALSEEIVAQRFSHFLPEDAPNHSACYVERYLMPGCNGINFLLHKALGGGGMASIRNDAQGKGFGQLMLDASIPVSAEIADKISQ
ncbi:MAG: DUF1446 domain-containing protein [Porticoccaceae bacterium]|nr:DUF1446 domain-containing protein [Porticoccaceae bacterium]